MFLSICTKNLNFLSKPLTSNLKLLNFYNYQYQQIITLIYMFMYFIQVFSTIELYNHAIKTRQQIQTRSEFFSHPPISLVFKSQMFIFIMRVICDWSTGTQFDPSQELHAASKSCIFWHIRPVTNQEGYLFVTILMTVYSDLYQHYQY